MVLIILFNQLINFLINQSNLIYYNILSILIIIHKHILNFIDFDMNFIIIQ